MSEGKKLLLYGVPLALVIALLCYTFLEGFPGI